MISCTLVAGGTGSARLAAIADRLDSALPTAVILEGIHPAHPAFQSSTRPTPLFLSTIAPDCPCCGTGLVLRVTLDRMIQRRPGQLFISLANAVHLDHLQQFLSEPPYADWLHLTPAIAL